MDAAHAVLARENAALKAALAVAQTKGQEVAAELAVARAKASEDMALIAQQKLRIAKLERQIYGQRSERSARLIDQLALDFEELQASATEDELAAEKAVARMTTVAGFTRKRPERNTFPDHLPRERVVIDPPTACECCGGSRLRKLGEDITRTLESQPRQWKVIETVREKFTCCDCEKISQAPAPFHVIARGWAGASLLAMIAFEKFGQHQPLNRQAERYALEGVPIALSTMADAVGSVCTALDPLLRLVEAHVMAAERLHGDDTTVPVLAKGKTDTGRCWVYVRDDKPFGGVGPPAAMFYYSRDRRGEHPQAHLAGYVAGSAIGVDPVVAVVLLHHHLRRAIAEQIGHADNAEIAADLANIDAGKRCCAGLVGIEFELAQAGAGIALHHHLGGRGLGEIAKTLDGEIVANRGHGVPDSTPPPAT